MKKIILVVFCLFLANIGFARNINNGAISNGRCFIQQALGYGALGYICPKYSICKDDCRMGQFVYFDFDFDFVDNQMYHVPKGYCLYADGVYRYENMKGQQRTVRKVKLMFK